MKQAGRRKINIKQGLALLKWKVRLTLQYITKRINSSKRKLPDFIIIGAMKGGTSSLFHYLSQHPDVEVSREQETHYFAKNYHRGLNYYRSFFPLSKSNKITGESSPYYLFHPSVPERIKKDVPNAKIIVLLRNPVDRAVSHYQMHKKLDEAENFDEALEMEEKRVGSAHAKLLSKEDVYSSAHQAFSYMARGKYHEQISRWLKYYSLDELVIIKSEDFFEAPKNTLQKIYRALDLKEVYPKDLHPINSRKYGELSLDKKAEYMKTYQADLDQLTELLGSQFTWS